MKLWFDADPPHQRVWIDFATGVLGWGNESRAYRADDAPARAMHRKDARGAFVAIELAASNELLRLRLPEPDALSLVSALERAPGSRSYSEIGIKKPRRDQAAFGAALGVILCVSALASIASPTVLAAAGFVALWVTTAAWALSSRGDRLERVSVEVDRIALIAQSGATWEHAFADVSDVVPDGRGIRLVPNVGPHVNMGPFTNSEKGAFRDDVLAAFAAYKTLTRVDESERNVRDEANALAAELGARLTRGGRSVHDWEAGLRTAVQPSHRAAPVEPTRLRQVLENERLDTEMRIAAAYALTRTFEISGSSGESIARTARTTADPELRDALERLLAADAASDVDEAARGVLARVADRGGRT